MIQRFTEDLLLLDRLALGGMAEVYRAEQLGVGGFQKAVAVKRILPELARVEEFKLMFLRETQLSANLQHPNIVQVFANGEYDGYLYLVMEYVDGKSVDVLMSRAEKNGVQLQTDTICFLICEVARGLAYAHSKKDDISGEPLNLVHRDVTPHNIMVSYDGNVKLVDFGIAKAARSADLTKTGVIKGKEGYLAPEQIAGEEADAQTDIFSLGIVFYELLAGHTLFESPTTFATLRKIVACEIPPLDELGRQIDPMLQRIVLKALAKNRDQRYHSADELLRELTIFKNRAFPEFTSADLARDMCSLFADDIERDRRQREKTERELTIFLQHEEAATGYTRSHELPGGLDGGSGRHKSATQIIAASTHAGERAGSETHTHSAGGRSSGSHRAAGRAAQHYGDHPASQAFSGHRAPAVQSLEPSVFPGSPGYGPFQGSSGIYGSARQMGLQPPRPYTERINRAVYCLFCGLCFSTLLYSFVGFLLPTMFSYDAAKFWEFLLRGTDMVDAAAFAVRTVLAPALGYAAALLVIAGIPALMLGSTMGSGAAMFDLFFNALSYLCFVFLVLLGYNFYIAVQQSDVSLVWFTLSARTTLEQLAQLSIFSPAITIIKQEVAGLPIKSFLASLPWDRPAANFNAREAIELCLGAKLITETFVGALAIGYLIVLVSSICRRLAFPERRGFLLAMAFIIVQILVVSYGVASFDAYSSSRTIKLLIIDLHLAKSAWLASGLSWLCLFLSTMTAAVLFGVRED